MHVRESAPSRNVGAGQKNKTAVLFAVRVLWELASKVPIRNNQRVPVTANCVIWRRLIFTVSVEAQTHFTRFLFLVRVVWTELLKSKLTIQKRLGKDSVISTDSYAKEPDR